MFTGLFQLEQKPVTVFSSDDADAPVLTKDAGSLKTLLKACLIMGYGGKTALGWEMAFESDDQKSAAFKSTDPTASQFYFKVDNSDTSTAKLSAYQEMTSIDMGEKPIVIDNIYQLYSSSWRLIGHSKAFILLIDAPKSKGKTAYPILFGDLPRESKKIEHICLLWTARISNYHSGGLQSTLFNHVNGNTHDWQTTGIVYATAYPFVINQGGKDENLVSNHCRFNITSKIEASTLYEPVLCRLADSTWTMIPMLQPLSNKLSEVGNLGQAGQTAIKAVTGEYGDPNHNNDCAVPINWWYA